MKRCLLVCAEGNVGVGDRGNRRIQVFNNGGEFKTPVPERECALGYLHLARRASIEMELMGKLSGSSGRRESF